MKQLVLARKPELMEAEFGKFLSRVVCEDIPFEIVCFPNYINDYDSVYKKIKRLEPSLDISHATGKKIWESIVDKGKIHL